MAHSNFFHSAIIKVASAVSAAALGLMICNSAFGQAVADAPTEAKEAQEASKPEINQKALEQVTFDIKHMSSDEMGGRQPGTPGIKLCEDYICLLYTSPSPRDS